MQTEQFWNIIATSKAASGGSADGHAEALEEILLELPAAEIASFQGIFDQCVDRAYSWDLWGAAYVIGGGCSDDAFTDFRSWLVSMGRSVYEAALTDPESLADVAIGPNAEEDAFFEEFAYAASRAYEEKTGKDMPSVPGQSYPDPAGEAWEEDEDELARRFPRLTAKYAA